MASDTEVVEEDSNVEENSIVDEDDDENEDDFSDHLIDSDRFGTTV